MIVDRVPDDEVVPNTLLTGRVEVVESIACLKVAGEGSLCTRIGVDLILVCAVVGDCAYDLSLSNWQQTSS